jgi:hypothetical protein
MMPWASKNVKLRGHGLRTTLKVCTDSIRNAQQRVRISASNDEFKLAATIAQPAHRFVPMKQPARTSSPRVELSAAIHPLGASAIGQVAHPSS